MSSAYYVPSGRLPAQAFVSIDDVQVERDANKEKKSTRPVIAYLRLPGMDAERIINECTTPGACTDENFANIEIE